MKYKIVTAFDENFLQHSTINLLNEFKNNWDSALEFHCYYHDLDLSNYSLPKSPNIHYHNLMEIEDYPKFLKLLPSMMELMVKQSSIMKLSILLRLFPRLWL